jgi:hypothetical protein
MDSAKELFEKLTSFKQTDSSEKTPQQLLVAYCSQVLGAIERRHVDFKQKRDRRESKLADDDKKNLAKAVSGFANSGGGVLIWGIEDKSMSPKPIFDAQNFVSALLELAPQVTDPIVQDIDGDWIPSDDESEQSGFGIIFIPESLLPPHRVILNQKELKNHYYIRSGEAFVVATHTQLEDMFGRRPKPKLTLRTKFEVGGRTASKYKLRVILGIENNGRGSAKSPFLSVGVHPPYQVSRFGIDGNMNFGLRSLSTSSLSQEAKYGASSDVVIHPGVIHDVTAVKVEVDVRQPPEDVNPLVIDYQIAAEGIQPIVDQIIISGSEFFTEIERKS